MAVKIPTLEIPSDRPLKIYLSVAPGDQRFALSLRQHMSVLRPDAQFEITSSESLESSKAVKRKGSSLASQSDLMLVLLSSEHLSNVELWEQEVYPAMKRMEVGEMMVVPILVRPCDWQKTDIAHMEVWMADSPVMLWKSVDEAMVEVVLKIQELIRGDSGAFKKDLDDLKEKPVEQKEQTPIDEKETPSFQESSLGLNFGDVFENLDDYNVLVIPCDEKGGLHHGAETGLQRFGFEKESVPLNSIGEVEFRGVTLSDDPQGFWIAFVTDRDEAGASDAETIINIGQALGQGRKREDYEELDMAFALAKPSNMDLVTYVDLLSQGFLISPRPGVTLTAYVENESQFKGTNEETATIVSSYNSDSVNDQEDQLDITPDVNAFAYLIASKKLEPPLSIGLFGDWGSGKSFFMQKMREKIDHIKEKEVVEIAESEPGGTGEGESVEFCKNIVQIEFNAWYYIDANLWACLVGTIFERLGTHLGHKSEEQKKEEELDLRLQLAREALESAEFEKQKKEEKVFEIENKIERAKQVDEKAWESLQTELNKAKIAVKDAQDQENSAEENYDAARNAIRETESDDEGQREELYKELASTRELVKEARAKKMEALDNEAELKEEIEKFKLERKQKEALLRKATLQFVGDQIRGNDDFKELVTEVKETLRVDLSKKTVDEVQQFLKQASGTGQRGIKLVAYWQNMSVLEKGIFILILLLLFVPIVSIASGWILDWDKLKEIKLLIGTVAAPVLAVLAKILKVGNGALGEVNKVFDKLDSAKDRLEKMRNIELDRLKKEYEDAKAKEDEAEAKLKALRANVKAIEDEVEEIKKGKRLSGFIERRLSSNDYQQYLGLVSLIRDDFNKLSQFLRKATDLSQEKGVERIVLYIDDLDRCPPEKVVDVLQAIHLILAFPLFVVVVGVDVRWISKSLIRRYGLMISPYDTEGKETDLNHFYRDGATPYAYLEKIFQIPFRLKPLGVKGKDKFISYLVRNDIKTQEETKELLSTLDVKGISDDLSFVKDGTGQSPSKPELESKASETESPKKRVKEELSDSKGIDSDGAEEKEEPASEGESQTGEEKKKLVLRNAKKLSITEKELTFIKVLLPVLGDSPRAVKRYINVFRLIKSNSKFDDIEVSTVAKHEGILVLLALIIGSPALSKPVFEELDEHSKETFGDLIRNFQIPELAEEPERAKKELGLLKRFLLPEENISKEIKAIQGMPLSELLQLANLVGRFSFRVD